MNKMTNKAALTIALNLINDALLTDPDECAEGYLTELAEAQIKIGNMIASLDKKAETAKGKPRTAKPNPEREERASRIRAYLMEQDEPKTCKEIAEALEMTSAKVSGAMGIVPSVVRMPGKTASASCVYSLTK